MTPAAAPTDVPPGWRSIRLLRAGALVLPLLLLLIWGWWSWRAEERRAEGDALGNAELVREYALRVMQTQDGVLALVEAIVAAAEAGRLPPKEVHERLAQLDRMPGAPFSAGYIAPDGTLTATSRAYPFRLDVSDRVYFTALRDAPPDTGRIDRMMIRPGGQDMVVFTRRRPGAAFTGILFATVPVEAFTGFFGRIAAEPSAAASLMRDDGLLLVGHRADDLPVQLPPGAAIVRAAAAADRGILTTLAATDGVSRIYGFARLDGRPLFANFGVGVAGMQMRWAAAMTPVALLLALAALLGCLAVDHAARALVAEDGRRRADAELAEARRAAALRETMLYELHHRVKNSLSLVQSLARLPGGGAGSRALETRVLALSKAHELLHVSQLVSRLDLAAFLRALCASPEIVPHGQPVEVAVDAEPVEIEVERATAAALIVAELLTNAVRHAFPTGHLQAGRTGRVGVTLRAPPALGGLAVLSVRDDGIGLPPDPAPEPHRRGGRSGLDLVDLLAVQIGGTVDRRAAPGGGTEVAVSLPTAPA